jgi:hypothetical protein
MASARLSPQNLNSWQLLEFPVNNRLCQSALVPGSFVSENESQSQAKGPKRHKIQSLLAKNGNFHLKFSTISPRKILFRDKDMGKNRPAGPQKSYSRQGFLDSGASKILWRRQTFGGASGGLVSLCQEHMVEAKIWLIAQPDSDESSMEVL